MAWSFLKLEFGIRDPSHERFLHLLLLSSVVRSDHHGLSQCAWSHVIFGDRAEAGGVLWSRLALCATGKLILAAFTKG